MIAISLAMLAACGTTPSEGGPGGEPPVDPSAGQEPSKPRERPPFETGATEPTQQPPDGDPDADADPNAPSPAPDAGTNPSTRDQLVAAFAPRLHLHPEDPNRPANVDWYLARVSLRFHHDDCPDHEVLALGKVTQASLVAQEHEDNKSLCRHDSSKKATTATSDRFFLEVADHAAYAGAPRAEWKTYVVWRPQSTGLVNVEYWFFYPYNDGYAIFNHESDWEHVRVTIDPKAAKAVEVKLSQHHGGQVLRANDPKLTWDATHPIVYAAKGTHANFPSVGSFPIEGVPLDIAKDTTKAAAPADVWKTETSIVQVGTRGSPMNGQVFVKYWGRWGELGDLPETNGVTRHFP